MQVTNAAKKHGRKIIVIIKLTKVVRQVGLTQENETYILYIIWRKRPKLSDLLVPKYAQFPNLQFDRNGLIAFTVSLDQILGPWVFRTRTRNRHNSGGRSTGYRFPYYGRCSDECWNSIRPHSSAMNDALRSTIKATTASFAAIQTSFSLPRCASML